MPRPSQMAEENQKNLYRRREGHWCWMNQAQTRCVLRKHSRFSASVSEMPGNSCYHQHRQGVRSD